MIAFNLNEVCVLGDHKTISHRSKIADEVYLIAMCQKLNHCLLSWTDRSDSLFWWYNASGEDVEKVRIQNRILPLLYCAAYFMVLEGLCLTVLGYYQSAFSYEIKQTHTYWHTDTCMHSKAGNVKKIEYREKYNFVLQIPRSLGFPCLELFPI